MNTAAGALACVFALLGAGAGSVPLERPDADALGVRGVDVSHHQGRIDWPSVAGAGIRFAYLKATEGRELRDPRFAANWDAAAAAGIARGAYHFFTFCSSGREQAEHFLRVAKPTQGALPPVADVEFRGNCKAWKSLDAVRDELRVFLRAVEAGWGTPPILYVTPESHEQITGARFDTHPVWIRSVDAEPAPDAYGGWLIWQFSESGRVRGIDGPVDLNVLRPGLEVRGLVR